MEEYKSYYKNKKIKKILKFFNSKDELFLEEYYENGFKKKRR